MNIGIMRTDNGLIYESAHGSYYSQTAYAAAVDGQIRKIFIPNEEVLDELEDDDEPLMETLVTLIMNDL
jgi:hypothetical protein